MWQPLWGDRWTAGRTIRSERWAEIVTEEKEAHWFGINTIRVYTHHLTVNQVPHQTSTVLVLHLLVVHSHLQVCVFLDEGEKSTTPKPSRHSLSPAHTIMQKVDLELHLLALLYKPIYYHCSSICNRRWRSLFCLPSTIQAGDGGTTSLSLTEGESFCWSYCASWWRWYYYHCLSI